MTVHELSREQMTELKQHYLTLHYEEVGDENGEAHEPSQYELGDVDNIFTDEYMYEQYEGVDFCDDDFFCTAF